MSPADETFDYAKAENYLLGDLTDDQAFEFECEVFPDEQVSEQLDLVRYELSEKHLRNELNPKQKSQFENHFLSFPYNAEIYSFQKSLTREVRELSREPEFKPADSERPGEENKGFFVWLAELFGTRNLAIPVLAGLLLIVLGIGFFYSRREDVIIVKITPTPTAEKTPEPTPNVNQNSDSSNGPVNSQTNVNNNTQENKPPRTPAVTPKSDNQSIIAPVLATILLSGSSREIGSQEKPLIIGKETKRLELEFLVPEEGPERKAAKYKLILETIRGEKVWEGSLEKQNSGNKVKEKLSPALFKTEQYRFRVVGVFPDTTEETVKSDTFFVKRIS
jgi:hypothetical protein